MSVCTYFDVSDGIGDLLTVNKARIITCISWYLIVSIDNDIACRKLYFRYKTWEIQFTSYSAWCFTKYRCAFSWLEKDISWSNYIFLQSWHSSNRLVKHRQSEIGLLGVLSITMTKPTKWPVRLAKSQISMGIVPVWSESSLSTWRNLASVATHGVYSKDPD